MPSLTDLRNAYRVQKEAKRVKKELKHIHVEAESSGVKVIVTGEQEVVSVHIDADVPREELPALLTDTFNRALKKSQVVSAERMQGIMGELGVGGPAT